jgi:hypothetical protein
VYIREAHPSDGGQVLANTRAGVVYKDPRTADERALVASDCLQGLKLSIPAVLDDVAGTVNRAYGAWPNRICIVGTDGVVAYLSRPGPQSIQPPEAEQALKAVLRRGASAPATQPAGQRAATFPAR